MIRLFFSQLNVLFMSFSILVSIKLLHIHEFLRFLPCSSCESIKTLIIHLCRNVFFFPNIECFACIFAFFVENKLKNTKDTFFCNVFLFLYIGLFASVLGFFYVKHWKKHVFCNFVLDSNITGLFIVLVPNIMKNTQETGFWKSRLISLYWNAL